MQRSCWRCDTCDPNASTRLESAIIISFITVSALSLLLVTFVQWSWLDVLEAGTVCMEGNPWMLCVSGGHFFNFSERADQPQCMTVSDWGSGQNYDGLNVSQQLEYWTNGISYFALLVAVISFKEECGQFCVDVRRSVAIVTAATAVLSITSLTLFTVSAHRVVNDLTQNRSLSRTYTWPFFIRVSSCVFIIGAFIVSVVRECYPHWTLGSVRPDSDDRTKFVSVPAEDAYLSDDESIAL